MKIIKKLVMILALSGILSVVEPALVQTNYVASAVEFNSNVQSITLEGQSIGLSGVKNARQLGGYKTVDGRVVKNGLLLRSAKLANATDEDIERLKNNYNLTEVIDFRDSLEKKNSPEKCIRGIKEIQIPISEETPEYLANEKAVDDICDSVDSSNKEELAYTMINLIENYNFIDEDAYVKIVESSYSQHQYHKFFKELVKGKGAILFHCSGGKDRTGVASVLLLSALGVDQNTILKDFELSNDVNPGIGDYMASIVSMKTDDEDIIKKAGIYGGVSTEYMEKALNRINDKYGSMDLYLRNEIGLSKLDLNILKNKYLE